MLLTLILASALPGYGAWSETDGVYYIKNGDGLEEAFTVDGSITYCNPGTNVPSYKDNGAVFVPKNAGEVISIEVLENTCDNTCYVLVYDGAIAKVGYGTSDGKDQSGYLPAGWKLKLQNNLHLRVGRRQTQSRLLVEIRLERHGENPRLFGKSHRHGI